MNRTFLVATAFAVAAALQSAPAQALNARSFISANGLDTNACTRTAPCRTLQKAHDETNPGGEISMLDPGGYGTVTITKAISIVNDGVGSTGILVPSAGTGITINAGSDDDINLRGLIIEGAKRGHTGILFNTGKSLTIENCLIRGMMGYGLSFFPTTTTSSLTVSNTAIAANSGTAAFIHPNGTDLTVNAVFSRVKLHNNTGSGLWVDATSTTGFSYFTVVAVDSVASNNTNDGFHVEVPESERRMIAHLLLLRSVSANNGAGVVAVGTTAILGLAQSAITGNADGFQSVNFGRIWSFGDNYILLNKGGNIGSLTPVSKE